MNIQENNWAEVYRSLNIGSQKIAKQRMFLATLLIGLALIAVFCLIFRKQPVVSALMTAGVLMFSGKHAIDFLHLLKNPKVYSGYVRFRTENSFTEEATMNQYVSYSITLAVDSFAELGEKGLGELQTGKNRNLKINCSETVYNELKEGDTIRAVVLPGDRSIAWFKKK